TRSGTLTVTDNASGSPQTASLTGTGVTGTAALSPTSLTRSEERRVGKDAAQTVTLTNSGGAALSISSIAVTGTNSADFGQTNICGSSLAASSSCNILDTSRAASSSTRSGTLTVTDNASGSPQTASLTGTGVTGTAALSPTSLT